MVVAALCGVLAGTLGFHRFDPGRDASAPPSDATTPTGSATLNASPSSSASASPTSPSPSPSEDEDGPPFTIKALLQPADWTERGWGSAEITGSLDRLPGESVTGCADTSGWGELEPVAFWATYQGDQTEAGEVVARFADADEATKAAAQAVDGIYACGGVSGDHEPDGVEGGWWETETETGRAVLAVTRSGDRVMVLSMESATSDPAETTDVDSLVRQATARLT